MKYYDVTQGSDAWFDLRKGVPSASNFHKILTQKTCKLSAQADGYAAELVGDKLSIYGPERPETYTNSAMRFGQQTEDEARRFYCMECGMDVYNGGWCTTDDGRFGCSPDALVGVHEGGLELKCPKASTHAAYLLDGGLPTDYRAQVHGCLIVTGLKWWDFLSYAPGLPPLLVRVKPDKYTDELRVALELFYARYTEALEKIRKL